MTNEQPTIYKFAYYYTTGDGSNDSDPYTNKDEAIEAFHEMVKEEITDEWTEEDDVIDYAKLWSCKQLEDEDETDEESILFWTFTYGFTNYDPPFE